MGFETLKVQIPVPRVKGKESTHGAWRNAYSTRTHGKFRAQNRLGIRHTDGLHMREKVPNATLQQVVASQKHYEMSTHTSENSKKWER